MDFVGKLLVVLDEYPGSRYSERGSDRLKKSFSEHLLKNPNLRHATEAIGCLITDFRNQMLHVLNAAGVTIHEALGYYSCGISLKAADGPGLTWRRGEVESSPEGSPELPLDDFVPPAAPLTLHEKSLPVSQCTIDMLARQFFLVCEHPTIAFQDRLDVFGRLLAGCEYNFPFDPSRSWDGEDGRLRYYMNIVCYEYSGGVERDPMVFQQQVADVLTQAGGPILMTFIEAYMPSHGGYTVSSAAQMDGVGTPVDGRQTPPGKRQRMGDDSE